MTNYPQVESSLLGRDKSHNHVKVFFEDNGGLCGSVQCKHTDRAYKRFKPFIYSSYGYEQKYSNNTIYREGLTMDGVKSEIKEIGERHAPNLGHLQTKTYKAITYLFLKLSQSEDPLDPVLLNILNYKSSIDYSQLLSED